MKKSFFLLFTTITLFSFLCPKVAYGQCVGRCLDCRDGTTKCRDCPEDCTPPVLRCESHCDECQDGTDDCKGCINCAITTSTPRSGKSLGFLEGLGALSDFNIYSPASSAALFSKFISTVIGVMTIVAFIWFIFTLLSGAIAWLGSGGDKQKLQNAQKQITTGLTGLIIVISAIFLIKIIGTIFGIDILDLQKAILNLQ